MRVCLLGTYEQDYPRNQILIKSLRTAGIDYFECHINLWTNKPHKFGIFKNLFELASLVIKLFLIYPVLVIKYCFSPKHDVVMFLYPGHLDVLVLGWLAKIRSHKVVFDAFVSLFDTMVTDRQLSRNSSLTSHILKRIDQFACQTADAIILDTDAHIDYFANAFKIEHRKFFRIFAGADTELFKPAETEVNSNTFEVLFIGKFTPLHGIDIILEAAQHLRNHSEIQFTLVGTGQLFDELIKRFRISSLGNVKLLGWLPYHKLPKIIQGADLCLGIFSSSDKACRVIPNKIFQALACKKPVLTARSKACGELLRENESILFVSPNNSPELADKILEVAHSKALLDAVAEAGYDAVKKNAGIHTIGLKLQELIAGMG